MADASLKLTAMVVEYLGYCRSKRRRPKTLRWYESKLAGFVEQLHAAGVTSIEDLTPVVLHGIIADLDDGTRSSYTLKGYVQVLKGWLHYLEKQELIHPRLRSSIELPKVSQRLVKTLSEETFNALYDATRFEMSPWMRLRDKAMLRVLLDTGVRAQEVCDLTRDRLILEPEGTWANWRHWDEDDDWGPYIRVIGKGDKEREVGPLSDATVKDLRRYLRAQPRQGREPLFISRYHQALTVAGLDQMLYRLRDWAGLGRDERNGVVREAGVEVRAHIFRHTFAVNCLREGLDIKQIADLLGHTSIQTTQIYLRDFTSREVRKFRARQRNQNTWGDRGDRGDRNERGTR